MVREPARGCFESLAEDDKGVADKEVGKVRGETLVHALNSPPMPAISKILRY